MSPQAFSLFRSTERGSTYKTFRLPMTHSCPHLRSSARLSVRDLPGIEHPSFCAIRGSESHPPFVEKFLLRLQLPQGTTTFHDRRMANFVGVSRQPRILLRKPEFRIQFPLIPIVHCALADVVEEENDATSLQTSNVLENDIRFRLGANLACYQKNGYVRRDLGDDGR